VKKILLPLLVLVAGGGIGGGAAVATLRIAGPPTPKAARAPDPVDIAFVPAEKLMAPLVLGDGRLAGYVAFDLALEVPADAAERVTARLPLLLHAINLRTYRTPLAAGPDGLLPNVDGLRRVVADAAPEAFGRGIVRRVAITRAEPA
jgi:hypothetical protein